MGYLDETGLAHFWAKIKAYISSQSPLVKFNIFNSVEDLGLTTGSATIAGAFAAMPNYSILIVPRSEFATAEQPVNESGDIEIHKVGENGNLGGVWFVGRESSAGDYRMFLDSSGTPTGTWVHDSPAIDFKNQCTFPKGKPAHFSAFALGGLAFISYQGPSLSNYAVQDVLVCVPEEYAFDVATFGQQHNYCSFNTAALGTVVVGANNNGRDIFLNQKATTSGNVRCYFQICYPIKK